MLDGLSAINHLSYYHTFDIMSTLFATIMIKINNTTPDKHNYLQILTSIDRVPKKIFYSGTLPEHRVPTIAIVGTRKPTAYGSAITYKFASELAKKGVVIVSGLALGVDGIAHTATCEAGGITLAVLPCGLPKIYPSTHHDLAKQIIATGGALISEYEEDVDTAYQSRFLERNRIVAGLADAILITEAAARSGTLNTAAHALNQGKDVFVVPGNITSPMSAGCNELIKQGAHLVTKVEDILEHIAPDTLTKQGKLALAYTPIEAAILEQLNAGIRDGDEIQRLTGHSAVDISTSLTMLEINGAVRALGANQWTLT